MCRLFTTIFFLSAFIKGIAAPISSEEAIQIASDFLSSQHDIATFANSTTHTPSPTLTLASACRPHAAKARVASLSDEAYYYVVNIGKGDGYVIVAGDDRAKQILGYSHEGEFDINHVSPSLTEWLNGYEGEMQQLMSSSATEIATYSFSYPTEVVAPLVQTKWDQAAPYNLNCPKVLDSASGTYKTAVVGCVATALAQVMKYHEWPARPTGSVSYAEGTRQMNFDEQPAFNWEHMRNEYGSHYTDEEAQAVANLSACCAYGSQMAFYVAGSGTDMLCAGVALKDYFGYDPNIYVYNSKLHNHAEWVNILMNELSAGRPILYCGANNAGAHAFVCDGYDGKGYFHFNWGWSGLSDGYFALTALNPHEQGNGGNNGSYTFNQSIICNIQRPGASASVPQEKKTYIDSDFTFIYQKSEGEALTGNTITTPKGADIDIKFCFDRENINKFEADMIFGYMENGTLHKLSNLYQTLCTPRSSNYGPVVHTLHTTGLKAGKYDIACYFRETKTNNEWLRMPAAFNNCNSIELIVGENEQTISYAPKTYSLALEKDLEIGEYYVDHPDYNVDYPKYITLSIKNTGDTRLEGVVGLKIQKAGSSEATYTSALAYCEPQEEAQVIVKLDIANAAKGDQYIITPVYCASNSVSAKLSQENAIDLGNSVTLTIKSAPKITAWSATGENFVLEGESKSIAINVNQGSKFRPWAGQIYGKIYRKTSEGKYEDTGVEAWSDYLDMKDKETRTTYLHVEGIEKLSANETYKLIVYINDGYGSDQYGTQLDEAPLILSNMPTGISLPTIAEGKMDVYNLDGTCVAKDATQTSLSRLQAGVYIIKVKTASAVVSKKIIIK